MRQEHVVMGIFALNLTENRTGFPLFMTEFSTVITWQDSLMPTRAIVRYFVNNTLISNGYIRESIGVQKYDYFTNELTLIICQYLGYCNNNLHVFKHSLISYQSNKYVIVDVDSENDTILIANNDNQMQKVKSGRADKMFISKSNATNKFVKILWWVKSLIFGMDLRL